MAQRTGSTPAPLIASSEVISILLSCPSKADAKCPLEETETQVAGTKYLATGTTYSKSPVLTTLIPIIEDKSAITSREFPRPEATGLSFQDISHTPASENSDLNGKDISDKRATLGDYLIVTTIIICNSPGNIIEIREEDYEARDNWLHHGHPVIDELDYRNWILELEMLEEVFVSGPGRVEPRRQLLNAIAESVARCKNCDCERDETGGPTGLLVSTGDDECPQTQADECNITYGKYIFSKASSAYLTSYY
ncbi:uncharacterized protein DFL_005527 [Arthrobotrys flagrans]|uniref:Uncharacterized protein n=1 Tax=Arthrobotrys flagrans TaxID=97331 RepID=A0A436ZXW0_ARTFL|nr:hypothetical protein DFL_005527 [Arthrobotrys flagrans]